MLVFGGVLMMQIDLSSIFIILGDVTIYLKPPAPQSQKSSSEEDQIPLASRKPDVSGSTH